MERTDNDTWDLVIGVGATATLVATATNAENPLNDDPFTECTVFADIDNLHAIAREEMFGPAVTITSYADDDDAIRIAGGCAYGPAGTVWTTDAERGADVARRIEVGTVGINHSLPDRNSPTSTVEASGVGV